MEVEWETEDRRGVAQAVSLTEDTGYFWFFDPDNVELVVKTLDACSRAGPLRSSDFLQTPLAAAALRGAHSCRRVVGARLPISAGVRRHR